MIKFKFILRYLHEYIVSNYIKRMNRKLNLFENLNVSISESVSNDDSVITSVFQSDTRDFINMQVSSFLKIIN